jgi:hypothetical protein
VAKCAHGNETSGGGSCHICGEIEQTVRRLHRDKTGRTLPGDKFAEGGGGTGCLLAAFATLWQAWR